MERPFRDLWQSLSDHCDYQDNISGNISRKAQIGVRDILLQAEKLLHDRAKGLSQFDEDKRQTDKICQQHSYHVHHDDK